MTQLMIFLLAVILAGIVAIGALFASGWDPVMFWGSIAWVIVLVVINWMAHAIIVGGGSVRRDGAPGNKIGSLPGIGVVTFGYAIASIGVLTFHRVDVIDGQMHLAIQIALLVVAAVLVLLALVAAKGAAHGSESPVSQTQLAKGLRRLQQMTEDPAMRSHIQDQINYVSYRMPHPSKLNSVALIQAMKAIEVADLSDLESSLEEFKRHLQQA